MKVLISTFNIHANILADGRDMTEWGLKFASSTHDILDELNGTDTSILVGVPGFYPPEPDCDPCRQRRKKALDKYLAHANHWPKIKWRLKRDVHLKCVLGVDKTMKGLAGGRNLTDSEALDVSFALEHNQAMVLARHFLEAWKEADPITQKTVDRYYNEDLREQQQKLMEAKEKANKLPFGKFKGLTFEEVAQKGQISYLQWLRGNLDDKGSDLYKNLGAWLKERNEESG